MRATPLAYEHESRRIFWVVRDPFVSIRAACSASRSPAAFSSRAARPTEGPSYVPTAQRSVWERILASPARVCMYLMASYPVGKCDGRLPGRPAAVEHAVVAAAHAGRRSPRRSISHVPRRHGGRCATGARDGDVARGRRAEGSGRACARAHDPVRHAARCHRRGRRRARVDRIRLAGRGRCRCRRTCRMQLFGLASTVVSAFGECYVV